LEQGIYAGNAKLANQKALEAIAREPKKSNPNLRFHPKKIKDSNELLKEIEPWE